MEAISKNSLEKGGAYYTTDNTYQKKDEKILRGFQNKMKTKLINNAVSILENYFHYNNKSLNII